MLRLTEIKLPFDHAPDALPAAICKTLRIPAKALLRHTVFRRGVDARKSGQPDGRSMIPRVIDHHLVRQTPGMGNPGQHVVPFGLQGTHEGSAHESRGTAQQNVHDLFS